MARSGNKRPRLEAVKKKERYNRIYGGGKQPKKVNVVDEYHFTITASDGSDAHLPQAGTEEILPGNKVDAQVEADDDFVSHWLEKVGDYLVHEGKWDTSRPYQDCRRKHFKLKSFPKGYKLFIHKKGVRHNPRKDAYLYGSDRVRQFRSPEEFALHAKWLAYGMPSDASGTLCMCHYCAKVPQGDISAQLKKATSHLGIAHDIPRRINPARDTDRLHRRGLPANEGPVQAKDYTQLGTGPHEEIPRWTQDDGSLP